MRVRHLGPLMIPQFRGSARARSFRTRTDETIIGSAGRESLRVYNRQDREDPEQILLAVIYVSIDRCKRARSKIRREAECCADVFFFFFFYRVQTT